MANFGSQLMVRVWPNTPQGPADVVLAWHYTRLIVMHLDGMRILCEAGAGPTALLQLRSMLEASLLLEWVAKADAQTKAHYLMVSNWRKERSALSCLIPGTPENSDFSSYVNQPISSEKQTNAAQQIARLDRILGRPDFAPINQQFAARMGRHEPEWYDVYAWADGNQKGVPLTGKLSIRAIANELGRLAEYRYLYSKMSNDAHGSSLWGSVDMGSQVTLHNIHRASDFGWMLRCATTFARKAYKLVLDRYRPTDDGLAIRNRDEWQPVLDQDWTVIETATVQQM
jgi:hypothetical protein